MVRPVINVSNRATEFEIKTLKLSYDNQSNVRAPMVWEKPTANLYDYHYDIGGIYYQPMVSYCMAREKGGRRKVVEIPDRILSNFDKRSYRLKDVECDYDGFLTQCYQRKIKDTNSRSIHCANERVSNSKQNTMLGIQRGAATTRDKYLNQVQLMYTEKLARDGKMKGLVVENTGDDRARRSGSLEVDDFSAEGENRVLGRMRNDARYGPAYERVTVLDSERFNKGEQVDFMNTRSVRAKSIEKTGVDESSRMEESSSSKTVRVVRMSGGEYDEEFFNESQQGGESKRKVFVNKDYLAADNMKEFLDVSNTEMLEKEAMTAKPVVPLFIDNTYSKAMYDVKARIKREGNKLLPKQTQIDDIKFNYRGRGVDQVGRFEKAAIRSTMFKKPKLPDFYVGYDTY